MDKEPESIWSKLADINPLYIVMGLFLVALFFSVWVWQTIHTPPVYPTPKFDHPTVVSPVQVLTERAKLQADQATPGTPAPQVFPTLDGTGTPQPWDG